MYKIALTVAVFALASCAQKKSNDAAKVEGYEMSRNGLQYKILNDAAGPAAAVGQFVQFSSTLRTLNGDLVFSTNQANRPTYGMVAQPRHKGDPMEVLQMVGAGDSVSVIIPESEFFKGNAPLPATVKKGDNIRMDIRVFNVYTAEQYNSEVVPRMDAEKYAGETKQMDDYIAAQGWTAVTLPSGLKVVVDKQGNGTPVTDGAQITVNYTGRLLNGTVFDSNVLPEFNHVQPLELTVGRGMVIKGWDEGLKNFNLGGKGKLVIPARLGYGEQGSGAKIPPNSVLVFDVEIISVKPTT